MTDASPYTTGKCLRCGNQYMLAVFASPEGYWIGQICLCAGGPLRVSKHAWETFNAADEALERGEFEWL